jgi:hypothetical protein
MRKYSGPEVRYTGMSSEKRFSLPECRKYFPDIQPPPWERQSLEASSSLWFHVWLHGGAIRFCENSQADLVVELLVGSEEARRRASLRPPLQLYVPISGIQLSRRRS